VVTIWTNGPAASLDARATRNASIAAKLQPEREDGEDVGQRREE
jgi:hypothetical protein